MHEGFSLVSFLSFNISWTCLHIADFKIDVAAIHWAWIIPSLQRGQIQTSKPNFPS